MPQIEQIASTYASQIFWLLVTFGALYFFVGKLMVPKIQATVEARDQRIAADLQAAEAASRDYGVVRLHFDAGDADGLARRATGAVAHGEKRERIRRVSIQRAVDTGPWERFSLRTQ